MRVKVNSEQCQGHLVCAFKAAELFDVDDRGYAVTPDRPLAGEAEVAMARDAANFCPERAIELVP
ncbi:ferredoxin [Pseudofrankia asymbiotica]|uniref:ferredoxin n=1 Tax=Pseudofrankia asymbiotica TaxID=1834516 RepID=UPI000BBA07A5|nr:ferredoxin [Pseudofrankia asymbiotica]